MKKKKEEIRRCILVMFIFLFYFITINNCVIINQLNQCIIQNGQDVINKHKDSSTKRDLFSTPYTMNKKRKNSNNVLIQSNTCYFISKKEEGSKSKSKSESKSKSKSESKSKSKSESKSKNKKMLKAKSSKIKKVPFFIKNIYTIRNKPYYKNSSYTKSNILKEVTHDISNLCATNYNINTSSCDSKDISLSSEMIEHLNFKFDEECKDIMIRIGNFLEMSPQLVFKYVCVKLNKLFTNIYTNENKNIPFCSTEHTYNINNDTIKNNKFKIYCILGLKILKLFLIKYLRSIRLCIPKEVRKRYCYDFLKIEYISKIYDKKYNLIDYDIFNKLSDKLKVKLIYFYIALNPKDVPNILIKIFKKANYNNENEVLYKYIKSCKFTSRGGKKFYHKICKEYIKLFEKHKLIKKHSSDDDILWQRFYFLIKKHNSDIINCKKLLKETYRLIFSKINFATSKLVYLFEKKGYKIFEPMHVNVLDKHREHVNMYDEMCNKHANTFDKSNESSETNGPSLNKLLKIGHHNKKCVINYITNLKKFIITYIEKNKSIYNNFYILKKNLNVSKNEYYDHNITPMTNLFHLTQFEESGVKKIDNSGGSSNSNTTSSSTTSNSTTSSSTTSSSTTSSSSDREENEKKIIREDIQLYCNEIINNTIDNILDIIIESSGFVNTKTLLGIYSSIKNNKNFKLFHFRNKFDTYPVNG
ncbi:conserved protein, unknown function [Hepatocystis sp. ex Piliocolobus tephrosceles]|nr:conserved protein, unknown function [Hepatocystis sp. ex Piliocolobus tephrosceles]